MIILVYALTGIAYVLAGLIVMCLSISLCDIPMPEIIKEEKDYPVAAWVFIVLLCLLWPLFLLKLVTSAKTWLSINKIYTSLIEVFFK